MTSRNAAHCHATTDKANGILTAPYAGGWDARLAGFIIPLSPLLCATTGTQKGRRDTPQAGTPRLWWVLGALSCSSCLGCRLGCRCLLSCSLGSGRCLRACVQQHVHACACACTCTCACAHELADGHGGMQLELACPAITQLPCYHAPALVQACHAKCGDARGSSEQSLA